ncbi:MAG: AAA family ATPase, partial [Candidatus Competibacterales bacterium]
MRFETLQLTRYGPFTDCTLSLPPAPLVLIYGPNEAGKSSALAALTDLLYGIGHQTPYAFRHAYGDLRLGGVISNRRGQRLALVRRKGRRNTLLDADDRPLPDDALAPFLAGVDRALFTRAFGLSQVGLRSGAEQLLQSNGALGEGLLEAGTGLKSLKALGEDLDARADELFGKRHSARRAVEQGLVRYRQAVEALRSDSLDPKVWGEALERVAEAEASEHDLRGRLEALGTRHRHLLWIQRLQPLKRRREQLRAQLASLGEVPDLPRDMASRCDHWLERRRQAQVDLGAVQRQMEELRTALAQCQVDPVVLAARDTIVALDEVRRDRRTAVEEGRPTLGRARAEVDRALGAIARRLGRSASRAAADYPGAGAWARVRRRAGEGLGLERAALAAEEQQSTAAVHLEALAAEREALTAIADPSPLRRQYQSLEDLAALDDQRLRLRHHHQSAQRRLEEAWGALEPRPGDLDALAVKPVPSRDEVEAFADREAGLERENQALGADRERADRARRDALARLRQLEGEDELPTAAVIDRVRAERDRHWRQLRARWGAASVWAGVASHGDEDPGDGLEEASHGGVGEGQTLAAFEAALAQVDILQERRASQAQRLADYAQAQEALRGEQIRLAELDAAATHHRRAMEQFATQWRGLWHNTGIIPRSPRAMGHWLTRREGVLARRLELEDAAAEGALAEARWQRAEARRPPQTPAGGRGATAPLEANPAAIEAQDAPRQ